jgi:small GTP-binding protein
MKPLDIVIVGHVDHGKSTLIGRLLYETGSLPKEKIEELKKTCEMLGRDFEYAYIMDSLEEERKEQKTIDTAEIYFKVNGRDYTIIDAPGHKEFLKNMITGASRADAAILITDVKEGIREQTRRHAYILSLIGIDQIILLINKMDLVDYDKIAFESIKEKLLSFMRKLGIESQHVIPISAKMGDNIVKKSENMSWYEGEPLVNVLSSFHKESKRFDLRLPIQDIYEINNEKVVVGRIISGEINKNDDVDVYPSKEKTKVKEIKIFEGNKTSARAGESIGIVFEKDVHADRGQIICKGKPPIITNEINAVVFSLFPDGMKKEEFVLRCATQEIPCTIEEIYERIDSSTLEILERNANSLKESEVGKVKIITKDPIVIEKFKELQELGRFVLERNGNIYAGGVII